MNCYYCDQIAAAAPGYPLRPAAFDTGAEALRCAWYWRFVYDYCGEPGHFMSRFYYPQSSRLLCRDAGRVSPRLGDFWAWQYWWELECPDCSGRHPSLDHAEFAGAHPWQLDSIAASRQRWLSSETQLIRYPPKRFPQVEPEDAVRRNRLTQTQLINLIDGKRAVPHDLLRDHQRQRTKARSLRQRDVQEGARAL